MLKNVFYFIPSFILVLGLTLLTSTSESVFKTRAISSVQESQLSGQAEQDFYHLTEGSDIYPYDWLVRIKSAYERDRTRNWDRGFFEGIETRVNAIPNPNPKTYLLDFIGLSSSWSSHSYEKADALKADPETEFDQRGKEAKLRWIDGKPSVRMVGVNCAFCHTGAIQVGSEMKIVNGSQAPVNLQRLYGDMVISTLALLINYEDQLEEFLVSFAYPRPEAKIIAKKFAAQSLSQTALGKKIKLLLIKLSVKKDIEPWFLEGEEVRIRAHFERLFRITHRLRDDQEIGNELSRRFEYLAKFAGGSPKYTTQGETVRRVRLQANNDGFGRLEAFISAGNRVFRERKDWVNNDAAVGFPPIWGIGERAIFHYTGNTNSVLIRNIGQAMGLGAIALDEDNATTVHIPNLAKLETLAYKIASPKWEEVFSPEFIKKRERDFKIDSEKAARGKVHYLTQCASCHQPQMVGPDKKLEYYPFSDLDEMGTDRNLAVQISKPINGKMEYSNIFAVTGVGIINRFVEDHPNEKDHSLLWLNRHKRGEEWIRESFKASVAQDQGASDGFPVVPKNSGYVSRDLKGVFATYPYLHNNSVPTLWDLLLPSSRRPQMFERGVNEFDPKKVGLLQRGSYTQDYKGLRLNGERKFNCSQGKSTVEDEVWEIDVCFDTKLSGNSNHGHDYGTELKEFEKFELIEYLKTL